MFHLRRSIPIPSWDFIHAAYIHTRYRIEKPIESGVSVPSCHDSEPLLKPLGTTYYTGYLHPRKGAIGSVTGRKMKKSHQGHHEVGIFLRIDRVPHRLYCLYEEAGVYGC